MLDSRKSHAQTPPGRHRNVPPDEGLPAQSWSSGTIQRVIGPGSSVAQWWLTQPDCELIGVLVPYPQALERILDVLPLIEADHRVQVVFIVPATGFQWPGMEEAVRALGGALLPWQEALETKFDLILAACDGGIRELSGPAVLMPHGVGLLPSRIDPWADEMPHLLQPENLMRDGEVVPAALCLTHEGELATLAELCPRAVHRALVTGDLSFDRMLASQAYRSQYRDELEVGDGQRLVGVNTTWGPHSLFGTDPAIFARVRAALPKDEYRVIGVIHPFVWHGHGRRQVLAWLSDARAAGVDIVEPDTWRAAAIGADLILGDHGSTTIYPAGLGTPTLMSTVSLTDVRSGSTVDRVAGLVTPLDLGRPLLPQVDGAIDGHDPQHHAQVSGLITSRPAQAGTITRRLLYGLLNLSEPSHAVPISPVPMPKLIR